MPNVTRLAAHAGLVVFGAIRGWKNSEFDIDVNGEATSMKRLRPLSPRTLLDVGANIGDWSLAALNDLPDATVHAFEIAPATAAKLILIGKLLPDWVGFKPFECSDQDFIGLNLRACRADRDDLISAIGCPALLLN